MYGSDRRSRVSGIPNEQNLVGRGDVLKWSCVTPVSLRGGRQRR